MEIQEIPTKLPINTKYNMSELYRLLVDKELIQCDSNRWNQLWTKYRQPQWGLSDNPEPITWNGSEEMLAYMFHELHYAQYYLYGFVVYHFITSKSETYKQRQLNVSAKNIAESRRSMIDEILNKSSI